MMTNGIGNVLVGQSGGPTAVINASLAGVYEAARSLGAPRIYGMKYGIQGFLQGNLVELDKLLGDKLDVELMLRTPLQLSGKLPLQAARPRPGRRPLPHPVRSV